MGSLPSSDLHFVLFPLMAQGHMIPIVDIARLLAQRGCTVTIITTPVNANHFKPVIARAVDDDNLKIQLLELTFPCAEVGLPQGCENLDMIKSAPLFIKMFEAARMLKEPAEKMLQGLTPAPSCIISDNLFPWTSDLARTFNIPRLVFHGPGCFTCLCLHIVMHTNVLDEIVSDDSEYFLMPDIPDHIEVTKLQALSWTLNNNSKEIMGFFETVRKAEESADGIVVNSFKELEPYYVDEFAKVKNKKVWCIGPVSLCNTSLLDKAERGSKSAIDQHDCVKWLDSKDPRSVIFVCLGSLACDSTLQNIEIGLGLELSKVSFIWCLRQTTDELEKWFVEERYEERVKDRGLIVRGWAPQVLILSHQAVSGFITHCGWNSTLEGVTAGVPMVTWPHFSDQFLNERFIVDVLKIGVKIGVEVPVYAGEQEKLGVMVTKENVKIAVEYIMSKGKEEEARRKRARELGEMAKKAMEEGGSSHLNLTSMIQDTIGLLGKDSTNDQDARLGTRHLHEAVKGRADNIDDTGRFFSRSKGCVGRRYEVLASCNDPEF